MSAATSVVTGAAGHLGTALCHALLGAGHHVRAVVRAEARDLERLARAEPRLSLCRGDVLDPAGLRDAGVVRGARYVFHAAAQISLARRPDPRARAVNVAGTQHIAALCQEAGARMIHVSSIQALQQHPRQRPLTEERPLVAAEDAAVLDYDRQKAEAERRVLAAVAAGLDAVIVNPASLLGPYDYKPSHMGRVLRLLHRGRLPALVAGSQSWVDVRDVAQGALGAAERGRRGERYLLAGVQAPLRDLLTLYQEVSGVRCPRLSVPLWLVRPFAPLFEHGARLLRREPLFTAGALQALRGNPDIRSDKARRELGYQLRPLRDTLSDTCSFLREVS